MHRYEIMLECWNEDPHDRPNFSDLRAKFGALLLVGKEDQYIALEVDEMKPYYTVKEVEEDEQRERSGSGSSEDSIKKSKGEEGHKDVKPKPSNPYVDHPARELLQSQTSQPVSMHSQPSLQSQSSQPQPPRGPSVPTRPANTLVDDEGISTDPYFDQLPTRPIPQPGQGSIPEEESSLGVSITRLQSQQSQQPSHESVERRTTNPYVEEPSSVPPSSFAQSGLLETSLTSSLSIVKEILHAEMNGNVESTGNEP